MLFFLQAELYIGIYIYIASYKIFFFLSLSIMLGKLKCDVSEKFVVNLMRKASNALRYDIV